MSSRLARYAVMGGVLAVSVLTLVVDNRGCDQPRFVGRLCGAGRSGWPHVRRRIGVGSISALLLLFMAGWTVYTGSFAPLRRISSARRLRPSAADRR